MKQLLTIILFLILSTLSFAGNNTIDSLNHELSIATQDTTRIKLLGLLSAAYDKVDRFKAFDFAKQALTLSQKTNNNIKTGELLNWLGDLYWYSGDYTTCSDYYFKALKVFEGLDDKAGVANCYRNIGWIYQGQNDYKQTLGYYQKALKINQELGLKRRIMINYDDFGIVYKFMQNYSSALEYAKKTIALAEEIKDTKAVGTSYGNLAFISYDMGQHEQAIEYFEKSMKILEEFNDYYNIAEELNGLANCYFAKNEIDKSISCLEDTIAIAEKNNFQFIKAASYEKLAKVYFAKKNYMTAYEYMNLYMLHKDSTYNENNSRQINEMAAKYEFDKKELQINSLEKEKEQEKEFKIYLIVFCTFIIGLSFFLYRGNVQKKKANNQLSLAYKQIEEKNKDITDSINYSKRIQEAILPPLNKLQNLFNEAFILYKPKDIVSGDFYWFAEKNGKKIIAACDCTGHGVPGALMSMIGNNFLNQIVNIKGITSPDEILNELHLELFKALNQNTGVETKDGMDIALLVFNSDYEVEYAGAHRPMWIVTEDEMLNERVVKEVKASKLSIGGTKTQNNNFSKNKLKLSKGDALYMFTDGYVDQFGGVQGKKYMSKNFKNLLLSVYSKSAAEQQILLDKEIQDWMGNSEQVDDILVIGIKV